MIDFFLVFGFRNLGKNFVSRELLEAFRVICVYFQKQLCANETGTDNIKLFILEDLVLSFLREIAGYRCLD